MGGLQEDHHYAYEDHQHLEKSENRGKRMRNEKVLGDGGTKEGGAW